MSPNLRRRSLITGAVATGIGGAVLTRPAAAATPRSRTIHNGAASSGAAARHGVCACAVWGASASASGAATALAGCPERAAATVPAMSASFAPAGRP